MDEFVEAWNNWNPKQTRTFFHFVHQIFVFAITALLKNQAGLHVRAQPRLLLIAKSHLNSSHEFLSEQNS
jgi:hypothetical protein